MMPADVLSCCCRGGSAASQIAPTLAVPWLWSDSRFTVLVFWVSVCMVQLWLGPASMSHTLVKTGLDGSILFLQAVQLRAYPGAVRQSEIAFAISVHLSSYLSGTSICYCVRFLERS